jgi:hypothetical protein
MSLVSCQNRTTDNSNSNEIDSNPAFILAFNQDSDADDEWTETFRQLTEQFQNDKTFVLQLSKIEDISKDIINIIPCSADSIDTYIENHSWGYLYISRKGNIEYIPYDVYDVISDEINRLSEIDN